MGEVKLFRLDAKGYHPMQAKASKLEKHLQSLVEANMETFLGVRFLASEVVTGKAHQGRIDSLGLDENYCPVIVEYKRHQNENVINQGLFYLDWLLDHKAEYEKLVRKRLGHAEAEKVDWSAPRLLCIAQDFTHYDSYAVNQINRNIELIRYGLYGDDLVLFELVNATTASTLEPMDSDTSAVVSESKSSGKDRGHEQRLAEASPELRELYEELRDFMLSLGDDVQEKTLKLYAAFKRIKNFASVVVMADSLKVFLKLDPEDMDLVEGFTRNVSKVGHWGTGDLEVSIGSAEALERAKPLIEQSFSDS